MERNILYKVHEEFNDIFTRWLSILIDFSVELDEDFTPKIQQDGYDVDYQNLSGGEKTSIALAYRLALNQVINRLMVHINTKGLLILDEPTDGFSSEQLDKVNDLLQQLEMQQIVLVSHENKIESFVDNIIRFEKQDNITQII
jgi:exonuclease SbcC